jgi:hypothetical protein
VDLRHRVISVVRSDVVIATADAVMVAHDDCGGAALGEAVEISHRLNGGSPNVRFASNTARGQLVA